MKKLFIIFLCFLICNNFAFAKSYKNRTKNFESIITESGIEKNSIAISVKNISNGKTIYEHNEQILMHPASVQKLLTVVPAIEILGKDYEYTTRLYKRNSDCYIIELGADPYFTSNDLKKLVKRIDSTTKKIYIDNSVIENKNWGEGWQWDDDLNVLMPKFNSYNLDNNLTKISIIPTQYGELATIINPSKYPLVFLNNVKTGDKNNIQIKRDNSISSNTLSLNGTVNKPTIKKIPTNNLKRYFDIKLTNTLADRDIYLKESFTTNRINDTDEFIDEVKHPVSLAINDILKNSNNMISETTSKLAGGKLINNTGTDKSGIEVFNQYCEKNKLDNSRIRLADASGVSKNNLVTADFVSEFLITNKNNEILQYMAHPGEGTLTHRMLLIKDNLRAKTGSLADISSIAGYITTRKKHKYAFCIIINDPSSTAYDMKTLEDYLLREVYLKL